MKPDSAPARPRATTEPRDRARLIARLTAALSSGSLAADTPFADLFAAVLRYQRRHTRPPIAANRPFPVDLFKLQSPTTFTTPPALVFFSSGTARGREQRSRHAFATADLYTAAVCHGFAQAVFGRPDLDAAWRPAAPRWNFLVPAAAPWWRDPHSSLAHMGRTLWHSLQTHADARLHLLDPAQPPAAFRRAVRRLNATRHDRVTLAFGASFGFLHLADRLRALRLSLPLHPNSRLMETGGYKGRGRELPPAVLHATLATAFALPPQQVFAEYGMTELSSQAYQVCDRPAAPRADLPVYRPADSLRVRALDPTGRPCLPGQPGLLELRDVMNLTSAAWLLTGDVGWVLPARDPAAAAAAPGPFEQRDFQVLGRAQQLARRGCGLAADLHFTAALTAPRPARKPPSSGRRRRSVREPA